MTGVSYATSAEMAGELGPFPGYAPNREPMLRVMRNHRRAAHGETAGYEALSTNPGAARPCDARLARRGRRGFAAHARAAWDNALALGEAARLPQRPGDRDRADRHDRPRHGLRHHRHRARLRAGEVQEARRRRLLQDHQPRRAGGAAHARLPREPRSPRSRPMPSAMARSRQAPGHQPHARSRRAASPTRRSTPVRDGARPPPSTSSSSSTNGRWARTS